MKKISKEEAHYEDQTSFEKRCADCSMFAAWTCTLVKGSISRDGYCIHWDRKKGA